VNIEDILFIRDVVFGQKELSPQGRINMQLEIDDSVTIDTILYIRDIIFGA